MSTRRRILFIGLTITSSWGNGHATTYRGLMRELVRRRHDVLFLERNTEWYAANRDLPNPPYGRTVLYDNLTELRDRFARTVRSADLVVVGSYVPDGVAIAQWVLDTAKGVTAFYDIDTPVTLAALARGTCEYLTASLVRRFDLYLSFTGGPTLVRLEREFGARLARPLYCSFDPSRRIFPSRASRSGTSATWGRSARRAKRRSSG
jgi:spore maturation protein CgeB